MIIAGTGHRPERLPNEETVRFKINMKLKSVPKKELNSVISGMADGYDLWLADEALKLKLPVVCARPWAGHNPAAQDYQEMYANILDKAKHIVLMDEGFKFPGKHIYQVRNEWMVQSATHLLAYWDKKEKGGTWETWKYARDTRPEVKKHNLWDDPPF